ncbi:MAG: GIY-YIG nuclease family protein [Dehalococcoidales bacterium]|nr:GIY-YIG nuclease family protein [Dehalococcoidales bacterium]
MSRRAITDQEWFFYIVRCRDDSLYSGITVNLEDRLREHNKGTGAKYTSVRRPVTLVYCERYGNVSEARRREEQIKRWSKTKKERLIVGFPRLRSD